MHFNCPLSMTKAARLIRLLELPPDAQVLDAGCGTGEFLIRVVEITGAQGVGIDVDEAAINAARGLATGRQINDRCEFRVARLGAGGAGSGDARDSATDSASGNEAAALAADSLDLAICLGATHAFGDGEAAYPNALDELARLVRPGGQLLIGEGYWKQPPAAEYLALLGDPPGISFDHAGNVAFAEARGLIPLYAAVSSEGEWDHFEWSHRMRIEREAAQHPEDAAIREKRERNRAWRDGYLRWGRTTMGFGFYLFMKPA